MTVTEVIARLRGRLWMQLAPALEVSATFRQHTFGEDSSAYCEIEVRERDAFAIVVLHGSPDDSELAVRIWHRHAAEVWLVDVREEVVVVMPRSGPSSTFGVGHVLRSRRLPSVAIPIVQLFEPAS